MKPSSLEEFLAFQNDIIEVYLSSSRSMSYEGCCCDIANNLDIDEIVFSTNNFPNPFNPYTTIKFSIGEVGNVVLNVYNVRGQRVRTLQNEHREPGHHSVIWDGTDDYGRAMSSGIYFYRIVAGENVATRRMLLMK